MVITKTLALKTMYGLMAVGATVGSVFYLRSQLSYSDTDSEVEKLSVGELLEKVGLDCGIASDEELTDSKDCSVKTEGSIDVKVGEKSEEGVSFSSSGTSKLKVSKEEGYPKKLKFVVDSGDLELTKTGGTSSIPKLEQFETYEIRRKGGKFYLSRRREAWGEKKRILGLGKCTLPKEGDSECTLGREEIKGVKFDNHSGVIVSDGDVKLKISRVEDTASFPENYRFTFTFPQEVTINSKNIKANTPYDFKIKKEKNSNTLTLEPAWTADSLAKKVGLKSCDESTNECTIPESGGNLRVKQLSDHDNVIKQTALTKKTKGAGSGKIKVTKDVEGYNQGFKFEIEGGSIELSGTTGTDESDQITRLGEYETYEIKEESDGWYLAIKDKADVFVLEQLGLTNVNGCSSLRLPRGSSGSDCRIEDISVLKKIKFGNASKHTWSSSAKVDVQLMIYQDSSLPVGFKFTFTNSSSTSLSLPDGSEGKVEVNSSNNAGVDYKIRKSTTGGTTTLCLEKKDGGGSSGCSK